MRTLLIGIATSLVAAVGLAGTASANATIDLIWQSSGTSNLTFDHDDSSTNLVLQVFVTAGAAGVESLGISVDYSNALGKLTVLSFTNACNAGGCAPVWPLTLGLTTNNGQSISNLNGGSLPVAFLGTGLLNGQTRLLGSITFHKAAGAGTFSIVPWVNLASTDSVIGFGGGVINATTTFNAATITNIPEPGTVSLLGLGLGALAVAGRRRK